MPSLLSPVLSPFFFYPASFDYPYIVVVVFVIVLSVVVTKTPYYYFYCCYRALIDIRFELLD